MALLNGVWSDASGGWGCGAMWGDASIAVKELVPIIIAVAI